MRRLTLLLVFVPLGTAMAARGETAVPPGKNGAKIVFVRGDKLSLMNTDGSGQRQVLRHEGAAYDPAWSPDGRRIAVVLGDAIWVIDANGAGRVLLAGAPAHAPAWSPDGRQIAYEVGRGRAVGAHVWVMKANGRGKKPLVKGQSPSWSPDGSIAFDRLGAAVYVMRSDGSGVKRLTPKRRGCSGSPAWSPGGARIAFVGNPTCRTYGQDIWVMRADGTRPLQVSKLGGSFNPAWSPDGRKLLFDSNRHGSGTTDVYVMNADGKGERRLTRSAKYNASPDWQRQPS